MFNKKYKYIAYICTQKGLPTKERKNDNQANR